VTLRVPKLRQQTFETAIIERYRRRESSVEEALIEMYLAGGVGAAGGGHHGGVVGHAGEPVDGVEPEQEDLCQHRDVADAADRWRAAVHLSRRHCLEADLGGPGEERVVLVATSVNAEGYREILKQSNIATAFTRCRSALGSREE
jgi:putative transposase